MFNFFSFFILKSAYIKVFVYICSIDSFSSQEKYFFDSRTKPQYRPELRRLCFGGRKGRGGCGPCLFGFLAAALFFETEGPHEKKSPHRVSEASVGGGRNAVRTASCGPGGPTAVYFR